MLGICLESPCTHQHSLLKAAKSEGRDEQQQQQKQRRSVAWTSGTGICMIMGTAPYHWRRDAACLLLYSAGVSKQTPTLPSVLYRFHSRRNTLPQWRHAVLWTFGQRSQRTRLFAFKHVTRPLMWGEAETKPQLWKVDRYCTGHLQ